MRILHMIDRLTTGGAQKLLATFGREAKQRGIQTEIVCLNSEANSTIGQELQDMGIYVAYFPAPHLMDPGRIWKVEKYLRSNQPDVIQTHLLYANIIGGLTGYAARIPVIATLHSTGIELAKLTRQDWLEARVMKYIDRRIVAVGYKTADAYQKRLGNKYIDVIPNGVGTPVVLTPDEQTATRRELSGDSNRTILISVGKFSPRKGYGDLIRSFSIIYPKFPRSILLLTGDGVQRPEFEELAKSLGLESAIVFLGNRRDVPRLLAASDLYLSSSIAEGMPLAVMEAMMAGLPVVATSVGDLPLMLPPDCGVLVPPAQPAELASAVASLLADVEKMKRMGNQAHLYAVQNFSSTAWIERLTALYEQVVQ